MMVVKPIIITATAMAFVQMATAASCCDGVTDPKLSSSVVAIASRGAKGGPLTKDLVTRVTTLKNFLVHYNDNDTSALELLDAPAVNVSASIHLDSHGNRCNFVSIATILKTKIDSESSNPPPEVALIRVLLQ